MGFRNTQEKIETINSGSFTWQNRHFFVEKDWKYVFENTTAPSELISTHCVCTQTPTSACGSKGLQQRLRKWVAGFSIGQFPIKVQPKSRAKTIYCRVQSFRFKCLTWSLIKQCLVCTRLAVFSFHGKAPKPTLMCFHQFLSGFNYHLLFFKSSTYKCYRPSFYNSIAAFVPVGMLLWSL